MELNSYELSRRWFNWCFENPEKVKPTHHAIYFFAIEHCNRLGWKEKFGFPTQMTMDAIGIKKTQTYTDHLKDLVDYGFIKLVEKSTNQHSANIISLLTAMPKNGKALDKALLKQRFKQTDSNGCTTSLSNGTIDKPLNNEQENQEPINNLPETKVSVDKKYFEFLKIIWFEFYTDKFSLPPTFNSLNGKKLKSIILKLETFSKNQKFEFTEEIAKKTFLKFLTLAYSDNWLKSNFLLSNLDSKFDSIIQLSKNGTNAKQSVQSANDRVKQEILDNYHAKTAES